MKKVVFIAMNSKYFRIREWVTKFVFEQKAIPINCLMIYGYYLYDFVPRENIIEAYKIVVKKSDELWVFGEISDGIRDAIIIARSHKIPVRYFDILHYPKIYEIKEDHLVYEEGVELA